MSEIPPISPTQPVAAPGRIIREDNKSKEKPAKERKKNVSNEQEKDDASLNRLDVRA